MNVDIVSWISSKILNFWRSIPNKKIAFASIVVLYFINKYYAKYKRKKYFENEVRKIREDRDGKITTFLKKYQNEISEELVDKITSLNLTELRECIRRKTYTSRQIVLAYCIRTGTVGKDLSLLADVNFEEALSEADKADKAILEMKSEEDLPDLLGLPISIKDHMGVKGMRATCGIISLGSYIDKEDGLIVKILRDKGAIPFTKSNVPQGLLSTCSSNHLWGTSLNPWDFNRSVGGSSGGEAGLLSSYCSPASMSSDMLGSIIIPSSYCGVYGLRNTPRRIGDCGGIFPGGSKYRGFNQLLPCFGPMSRTADDLILLSKNLFGQFEEDHNVNNKVFDMSSLQSTRKLKIAYINSHSFSEICKSSIKAVEESRKVLESNGHTLVPISTEIYKKLYFKTIELVAGARGLLNIIDTMQGEELFYYHKETLLLSKMSSWTKNILYYLTFPLGLKRERMVMSNLNNIDTSNDLITSMREHNQLKDEFKQFWKKEGFDAMICPAATLPAVKLGSVNSANIFLTPFTAVFNALEMPGVSMPVFRSEDNSMEPVFNDKHYKTISESNKDSKGLPISVQIVAMTNMDEVCLRLMKELDNHFKFAEVNKNLVKQLLKEKLKK